MSNTTATTNNSPTHIAYHVIDSEPKNIWTRIGAVWAHKDQKGFTLKLELIPTGSGEIVIRENSPAE